MNRKLTEALGIVATMDPASNAAGTYTSAWVPASAFKCFAAYVDVGAVGSSATVTATILQALDSSGTSAKTTGISTVISTANTQAALNLRPEQSMDVNNNFTFIALQLVVATAACSTSAAILGLDATYQPAQTYNAANVTIVN